MKRLPLLISVLVSVSAMAILIVYSVGSAPLAFSYNPFVNLTLDPESVNPYSANTLQLKSFGFLSPTPEPHIDGSLVDCGPDLKTLDPKGQAPKSENKILSSFSVDSEKLILWYRDEWSMAIGIGQVVVNRLGSQTADYPIELFPEGNEYYAKVESTDTYQLKYGAPYIDPTGDRDYDAVDTAGAPIFPSIFITNITSDPASTAGDWVMGGIPVPLHSVYGQWKVMRKIVDANGDLDYEYTEGEYPENIDERSETTIGWGTEAIPPANALLTDGHGYHLGAAVWDLQRLIDTGLMARGNTYRVQFMVHDGDQTKFGGDLGIACGTVQL